MQSRSRSLLKREKTNEFSHHETLPSYGSQTQSRSGQTTNGKETVQKYKISVAEAFFTYLYGSLRQLNVSEPKDYLAAYQRIKYGWKGISKRFQGASES